MAPTRYKVTIFEGAKAPQWVRSVGWFMSPADAEAWREQQRLGGMPVDGEWAVVIPSESEEAVEVLPEEEA
jgi:hypothetical protein